MRYRDASHVDVGSFYDREPRLGRVYRLLGYLGVVSICWCIQRGEERSVACLMVACILVWLAAWYQVVGTLWRTAWVAAILAGAVYLTWQRLATLEPRESYEVLR